MIIYIYNDAIMECIINHINKFYKNKIIIDGNTAYMIMMSLKITAVHEKLLSLTSKEYTQFTLLCNTIYLNKEYWYGVEEHNFAMSVYKLLYNIIEKSKTINK